ncbi:MAG TPA: phage protein NinX family protein [Lelliottia sp.]|jgi:hypothetical protein
MDYSKLSDFEINKRVAICIHPDIKNWNCYDVSGRACFVINEGTPKRVQYGFSFTSDPSDAWPIISANRISVEYDAEHQCDIPVEWVTAYGIDELKVHVVSHQPCEKALRSAMIVFLMMQESANVQDNPSR